MSTTRPRFKRYVIHYSMLWFSEAADRTLLALATVLATGFVLTQEFYLHNLRGENIYDPNDAIASVLGMALMVYVLNRFGFFKYEGDARL